MAQHLNSLNMVVSAFCADSSSTIIPEGILRKPHKFGTMLQIPPPKWWNYHLSAGNSANMTIILHPGIILAFAQPAQQGLDVVADRQAVTTQ
jgi:hypothetical protein